jgi:hypothetical protein
MVLAYEVVELISAESFHRTARITVQSESERAASSFVHARFPSSITARFLVVLGSWRGVYGDASVRGAANQLAHGRAVVDRACKVLVT